MEQKIFEIVRNHDAYLTTSHKLAKEIAELFKEFIEWTGNNA
jgi:hypothetical protein